MGDIFLFVVCVHNDNVHLSSTFEQGSRDIINSKCAGSLFRLIVLRDKHTGTSGYRPVSEQRARNRASESQRDFPVSKRQTEVKLQVGDLKIHQDGNIFLADTDV